MITPGDTVYLAGPMTGRVDYNRPAFFALARLLERQYGCRVLNPARQPDGLDYEEYMDRGFADVRSASAIVLLSGWDQSPGARREYALAEELGRRIYEESDLDLDLNSASLPPFM